MRLIKFTLIGLLCANIAHAEISVVEEFSTKENAHTAKVLSKQPIYRDIVQTISKPICRNIISSTHYDPRGKIEVVYRNQVRCNNEISLDAMKILVGYSVSYEYNGKYFSTILDYDPGEYVSIHSGK